MLREAFTILRSSHTLLACDSSCATIDLSWYRSSESVTVRRRGMLSSSNSSSQSNSQRCYHFERGRCFRGRNCRFLHSLNSSLSDDISSSHVGLSEQPSDISQNSTRSEVSERQPCRHFFQTGWCAFGNNCRYSHSVSETGFSVVSEQFDNASSSSAQQDAVASCNVNSSHLSSRKEKPRPSKKICKFFKSGHCRLGQKCRFQHIVAECPEDAGGNKTEEVVDTDEKKEVKDSDADSTDINEKKKVVVLSPSGEQDFQKVRATEIRQLQLRYPRAEQKQDADQTLFRFVFEPSDPDWVGI